MRAVEASRFVAMLIAAYPNAQMSDATSKLYESMLADLEAEAVGKAIARLIASSQYMPSVAQIRATEADIRLGPVRAGGEAWGDVVGEIRRVGYVGRPKFTDPIVAEIVQRWGWRELCCNGSDVADRARFIELYDQLASERRVDVASGIPLPPSEHRTAPKFAAPRERAQIAPTATVAELLPRVEVERPAPRREFQRPMTADEIDAALEGGGT